MQNLTRQQAWLAKAGLMLAWPVIVIATTVIMFAAWFVIPFMDASVTARLRKAAAAGGP